MVKISVLIAVYNTGKYLSTCLNSLLGQTLKQIEIICIDDASTDDSVRILKDYAEKDERIKLICLSENQGIAHARNEGLKRTNGEIICFVDSDDWLAENALEKIWRIYEKHPSTDSVLFNAIYYYNEERQEQFPMETFEVMSGYDAFVASLTWEIHGIYAVRREIHLKYPYDETCRTYSDENITRLHYLASREVRLSDGKYYYRQHASSVTHCINGKRFDYLRANESMKRQLLQLNVSEDIINLYENVRWRILIGTYMFYFVHRNELPKQSAAEGLKLIHKTWHNIEQKRLDKRLTRKFGYMPLRLSWWVFRLQEEIYFTLRGWMGKNTH